MRRTLPRGVRENDPRIYHKAKTEAEAVAKVQACAGRQEKLNWLLRRCAYEDDLVTATKALEAGADPNSQNLLGESPMISICQKGSVPMLRLFLKHGANLGLDKFGVPPLIHAIHNFREDLVAEMINAGADVNVRDNRTLDTPLHLAATRPRCFGIVKRLLEAGADPRAVNAGGQDVLGRTKQFNEQFGGVKPEVFRVLEAALDAWKNKPPQKKARRKPRTEAHKFADKYVNTEPGEQNVF